jgi:hypothetical protein
MFKKFKIIAVMIAAGMTMSGCALTLPVTATSNPVGMKVGTSKATGYLGFLFFGQDAGVQRAAKNGGITKISTVDIKQTNILGLVIMYETIVTGE